MDEQSIFLSALEKTTPDERSAYLDSACAGNAALRNRVERLLARQNDAGAFLEQPPRVPMGAEPPMGSMREEARREAAKLAGAADSLLDFLTPSEKPGCLGTLGQYEILSVVGRGGMGIVLKAHDTSLQRIVALKVLAPELAANAVARQRFLREARAAAAVVDPHIVTIHAVDEPRAYLVMEMVDGKTLHDKIRAVGMIGAREVVRIGYQAALGLAAAHKQGLIHRDVKPANILLENGVERVKITDFGLARACDDVGVTKTGEINGTPQFMSPEQAQGAALDHRSDLFSLGSVLYAMCTGHPPFRGDNVLSVLRRVADGAPRPIRESNPDIPPWLCDVIGKLMAKRKEDRYQSAMELANRLEKGLASMERGAVSHAEPTTLVHHDPTVVAAKKRDKQKSKLRLWLTAFVLLCIAFVLQGISIIVFSPRENHPREGVAERSDALDEDGRAPDTRSVDGEQPIPLDDDSDFGKPPASGSTRADGGQSGSSVPMDAPDAQEANDAVTRLGDQARQQADALTAEVNRRVAAGDFGRPADLQQVKDFVKRELQRRKQEGLVPPTATIELMLNGQGQVIGRSISFSSLPLGP